MSTKKLEFTDNTTLSLAERSLLNQRNPHVGKEHRVKPDEIGGITIGYSPIESEIYDIIEPVNPYTGHRDSALSRLFAPKTSSEEKNFILSQLAEVKGKSSPKELIDEDLINLLPSRYANDPTEIARYQDRVNELLSFAKSEKEKQAIQDHINNNDNGPTSEDTDINTADK